MMQQKYKGVRTQHPSYAAAAAKWKRCRDAAAGQAAIYSGGVQYLPKLAEETDTDYGKRLKRTPFFNATWRTISGLRGMLFRKPAKVELPSGVVEYAEDVDMAGSDLQTFAQKIAEEALTVGRVAVLVDYPQKDGGELLTVAQAASLGMRPSLQRYPAETLINWRVSRVGNAAMLTLAVLTEEARTSTDEYGHDCEMRYRVLDLHEGKYRQRLFRINDKGEDEQVGADVYPLLANAPLPYIPLVVVGVDCCGHDVEDPPLNDLVDMNLHHFAVSADYEHGCHFQGLPTLFISGHQAPVEQGDAGAKIYIGGPTANALPNPQAKAYFCEVSGDFEALRKNLEDKKAQMAILGARMLETQRDGVEAAETAAQHRKGEESQLSAMAQTVSRGLTQALRWFAEWAGVAGDVEYELNRDFLPVRMGAQELAALVAAWQSGAISQETLFDNLKRGEVIAAGVTFEVEQGRTANGAPTLVAPK